MFEDGGLSLSAPETAPYANGLIRRQGVGRDSAEARGSAQERAP